MVCPRVIQKLWRLEPIPIDASVISPLFFFCTTAAPSFHRHGLFPRSTQWAARACNQISFPSRSPIRDPSPIPDLSQPDRRPTKMDETEPSDQHDLSRTRWNANGKPKEEEKKERKKEQDGIGTEQRNSGPSGCTLN